MSRAATVKCGPRADGPDSAGDRGGTGDRADAGRAVMPSVRRADRAAARKDGPEMLVEAMDLHAGYGEMNILEGVSLALEPGEIGGRHRPQRSGQVPRP